MPNISDISRIYQFLSSPTWDVLIIFFAVVASFFYGMSAGKSKLLSVIFSVYLAMPLFENFPYLNILVNILAKLQKPLSLFYSKAIIFVAIVILLNLILRRTLFRLSSRNDKWWQVLAISIAGTGFVISALFHFFSINQLAKVSPFVSQFFIEGSSFFWWLVLPLVVLFFIIGKRGTE
ncbi:MAG: hypothetical protein Q7R75_01975 [bacterium]|nr:hypothetical protein [bacterium]